MQATYRYKLPKSLFTPHTHLRHFELILIKRSPAFADLKGTVGVLKYRRCVALRTAARWILHWKLRDVPVMYGGFTHYSASAEGTVVLRDEFDFGRLGLAGYRRL